MVCRLLLVLVVPLALSSCAPSPIELRRDGVKAFEDHDYVTAVQKLEDSLLGSPNDQLAHQYMALSNERLEQYPQAKAQYEWMAKNGETKRDKEQAQASVDRLKNISGRVKPRIVLLSADWCKYSKRFTPTFKKVADEFKDKVDCVIIDIEKPERKEMKETYNQYIAKEFGGSCVPAFVFECRHGSVVRAFAGELTEEQFRDGLKQALTYANEEKDPG